MCKRITERFYGCNCFHYQHGIDACISVNLLGHGVEDRVIWVGRACPKHYPEFYNMRNVTPPYDGPGLPACVWPGPIPLGYNPRRQGCLGQSKPPQAQQDDGQQVWKQWQVRRATNTDTDARLDAATTTFGTHPTAEHGNEGSFKAAMNLTAADKSGWDDPGVCIQESSKMREMREVMARMMDEDTVIISNVPIKKVPLKYKGKGKGRIVNSDEEWESSSSVDQTAREEVQEKKCGKSRSWYNGRRKRRHEAKKVVADSQAQRGEEEEAREGEEAKRKRNDSAMDHGTEGSETVQK